MTQFPDVRRHLDGSIDFDFYKRRASRGRQRARQLVFARCLRTIGRAGEAALTAIRKLKPMPDRSRAPTQVIAAEIFVAKLTGSRRRRRVRLH
jgi:hypothetical protein